MRLNLNSHYKKVLSALILLMIVAPNIYGEQSRDKILESSNIKEVAQSISSKKRITGRVTEENGEPLAGVSILEEGTTTNGTTSDIDGMFELHVGERAQIVFSYLGFKPERVSVGSSSIYDVFMKEDINELEELVVTGYGQQRKISSIGAQSTLKVSDMKAPTASLSTVLAGRLSGIVGVQRTGEPGKDAADLWIRGISTPNGAKPLILVDGVERPFNDIDPEDVESVSLLKDASATAVYGVRGANGVVVINPTLIHSYFVSLVYGKGRFQKS